MAETFTNNAATTLSAAIFTPTSASCIVVDATAFPAAGDFRIKIDGEVLIVTAVSGSTFTVTRGAEGTAAATHASGANVIHLLTKGSLEARIANRFISGPYASKPTAGVKGRLFLPTDGLFLEYDDGTAWRQYGPYNRLISPPQAGWSWVNQGNATATFTNGVLILEDPDLDANATEVRLFVRPIKQLPATVTLAFAINGVVGNSASPYFAFCARSSGGTEDGQFTTLGLAPIMGNQLWQKIERCYASPTATETGGQAARHVGGQPQRLYWWRFSIVGNMKYAYFSADGVNWLLQSSNSLSTNSTPNQFGICIDPQNNAQKMSMTLVHWDEG
jgi:hypothetical protein